MIQTKKSDFESRLKTFEQEKIEGVWYWGDINLEPDYHSISRGVIMRFESGKVVLFAPADEFGLKLGYGISFREIRFWKRESIHKRPLQEQTDNWELWRKEPLSQLSVQWQYTYHSRYYQGTHHQTKDFPIDLEFKFENTASCFLSVAKVWNEKKTDYGTNHLTLFLNKTERESHFNRNKWN